MARSRAVVLAAAALSSAVVLAGCGASAPGRAQAPVSVNPSVTSTRAVVVLSADGREVELPLEVAADPEARRMGLMGREALPEDGGMLFLFPATSSGPFWMKGTRIPLSIAFYGDGGEILRILDMEPCVADPCPLYDPGVAYLGAIEVPQGRFAELGIGPGWRVVVPPGLPAPS